MQLRYLKQILDSLKSGDLVEITLTEKEATRRRQIRQQNLHLYPSGHDEWDEGSQRFYFLRLNQYGVVELYREKDGQGNPIVGMGNYENFSLEDIDELKHLQE